MRIYYEGTYVSEGTIPKGSMWSMNPIPRNDTKQTGQSFKPKCEEVPNCGSTEVMSQCFCSGMNLINIFPEFAFQWAY